MHVTAHHQSPERCHNMCPPVQNSHAMSLYLRVVSVPCVDMPWQSSNLDVHLEHAWTSCPVETITVSLHHGLVPALTGLNMLVYRAGRLSSINHKSSHDLLRKGFTPRPQQGGTKCQLNRAWPTS